MSSMFDANAKKPGLQQPGYVVCPRSYEPSIQIRDEEWIYPSGWTYKAATYEYTSEGWYEMGTRALSTSRHPAVPFGEGNYVFVLTEQEARAEVARRNRALLAKLEEFVENVRALVGVQP